ncbi:MAG: DUF2029 domain-containing protein [Ferrovum sp.]|nr:DUF2029 domain-containing protein [Ferrovum sp.]
MERFAFRALPHRPKRQCFTRKLMKVFWTSKRIGFYAGCVLVLYLFFFVTWGHLKDLNYFPTGHNGVTSFSVFWVAARDFWNGSSLQDYSLSYIKNQVHLLDQQAKFSGDIGWFYPPTYFIFIAPIYWLPFSLMWQWTWVAMSGAFFIGATEQYGHRLIRILVVLASPGVILNFSDGQNGLYFAGLMAFVLYQQEKNPKLAGVALGLLACKPQWVLLILPYWFLRKEWTGLFYAFLTSGVLILISLVCLGPAVWYPGWWQGIAAAKQVIELNPGHWRHGATIYSLVRTLGGSSPLAYGTHGLVAVLIVGKILWRSYKRPLEPLEKPLIVLGTFLVSPYWMDYDEVGLLVAIGFWVLQRRQYSSQRWAVLEWCCFILWLFPALVPLSTWATHIQWGPLVLLIIFFIAGKNEDGTQGRKEVLSVR